MRVSKFSRCTAVGLFAVSLMACGKPNHQTARIKSKSVVTEINQLYSELQSSGDPALDWNIDQIRRYEQKLNRLQQYDKELIQIKGVSNIVKSDALNIKDFIRGEYDLVIVIRAEKAALLMNDSNSLAGADAKLTVEMTDMKMAAIEIKNQGPIVPTWTTAQLLRRRQLDNRGITDAIRATEIMSTNNIDLKPDQYDEVENKIRKFKQAAQNDVQTANQLLDER